MANSSRTTGPLSAPDESTPYVGPRPFTTADQDIFFGRNQEAIELTSLVKAHPEVLLYAQSGAGKTSLLFAQVIPILDLEEEFDVLPPARVRSQESAAIPQEKIRNIYMFNAFKDLSDDKLSPPERAQLTLVEYLKAVPRQPLKSAQGSAVNTTEEHPELRLPRVVIFDQFEEIFTLYPERYKDRQDFFSQVAAALEADPFLRVIFSMREDYIAEFDPYVDILPQDLRTRFRLERLRKSNAISAVKQPLETQRVKGRRQFAPGVAELLVDRLMLIKVKTATGEKMEVAGEFVDPVQLQVVCQTLWQKLPPDKTVITKEDLDKYADVEEALLNFYEASVRKAVTSANDVFAATTVVPGAGPSDVTVITEGALRGWFEQKLITREGKRNMVFREGGMTAGLSNVVVDELENQHVIRVEMRGGEPWYELSHDRFIPPIRESNKRFLLEQPLAQRKARELEARADDWLKAQRSVSLLLNRAELLDAQDWMDSEAAAIGFSETLFSLVRASEAAIEHEDSKQQQLLAAAQQRSMILERQRSRQLKIGFVVASLLLVVALGSTAYAFMENGRATREAIRANKAKEKAEKAAADLTAANTEKDRQRLLAEEQRENAIEQKGIADRARTQAEKSQKAAEQAKGQLQVALADSTQKGNELARINTDLTQTTTDLNRKTLDLTLRTQELSELTQLQAKRAGSLKLAIDANSQLAIDPELALRLGLEANGLSDTEQAKSILLQAYLISTARGLLKGHTEKVWQAVYSPDGGFISTASEDGTVKMWDPKTYKVLKTFEGKEKGVHALAISFDGSHIATEAVDKGRLWNVGDGTSMVLDGLTGPVAAIAFSPNGRLVATEATSDDAADDKKGAAPRIWDVATKALRHKLVGHDLAISALTFSPDSKLLATASRDNTARIWDVVTGRELQVLRSHTEPLTSVAFDPTGQFLVTGSSDGTARVWEVASGKEKMPPLQAHAGGVRSAVFSPDGTLILTVGQNVTPSPSDSRETSSPTPTPTPSDDAARADNTIRVWNAKDGDPLTVITEPASEITRAIFSFDSKMIATSTEDGTVRVWEATGGEITKLLEHSGNVNSIAFSPDGKFLLTGGGETPQVWKILNSINPARDIARGRSGYPQSVRFDSTGKSIVAAGSEGMVRFRKVTGELNRSVKLAIGAVYDIAISPDNKFVLTASRRAPETKGGTAKIDSAAHYLNFVENKLKDLKVEPTDQASLGASAGPVKKVAYSPRGTYALTVTGDRVARVWETSNWTAFLELKPAQKQEGLGVWAFDPSEKYLVRADDTGHMYFWELSTGTPRVIETLDKGIVSVAFSQKGDLIVTASADSTATVWTSEGKPLFTLYGHQGKVRSAEFSPDGKFIVTGGADGTVRVWDADTGSAVNTFKISEDVQVVSASFGPDSKTIVVGDLGAFIYVLDCEMCRPFDEIIKLANGLEPRPLTAPEKQRYMNGVDVPSVR